VGDQPGSQASASSDDALPEAVALASQAGQAGIGLKLLGGLAVRVLTPDLPPRLRPGQDMDFACLSKGRKATAEFLEASGCVPDRRFNNLNGDRQMYFTAPSGRPIDVMVDRLSMCHVLDFRPGYTRLPLTLDAVDILLSKLQIVELNEKDARDIFQLLAGLPVSNDSASTVSASTVSAGTVSGGTVSGGTVSGGTGSGGAPVLDTRRFGQVLATDWGWWRTVTANLAKLPALASQNPALVPADAPQDPVGQAGQLADVARTVPKSMKWKLRANVGDRVRWYELPEEVGH